MHCFQNACTGLATRGSRILDLLTINLISTLCQSFSFKQLNDQTYVTKWKTDRWSEDEGYVTFLV